MRLHAVLRADLDATRKYTGSALPTIYPGFVAVVLYRLSHALWRTPWKPVGWLVYLLNQFFTGAEIPPTVEFGPGLYTPHPNGIVLAPQVRGGRNVVLFSGVVLGSASPATGVNHHRGDPVLGDGVTVFTKATVVGPVRIGDWATIGAHALVLEDVAAHIVVAGAPARPVHELSHSQTATDS